MTTVLKERRIDLRKTQAQVAKEAQLSRQHLSNLENGKVDSGASVAHRLANALECKLDDIFLVDMSTKNYRAKTFERSSS